MLGEVRYQPLYGTPAGLDVGEPTFVGCSTGKVGFLLRDDTTTKLLGSSQLQPTPNQRLRLVNAAPEVLGSKATEARVTDRTQILLVRVH